MNVPILPLEGNIGGPDPDQLAEEMAETVMPTPFAGVSDFTAAAVVLLVIGLLIGVMWYTERQTSAGIGKEGV